MELDWSPQRSLLLISDEIERKLRPSGESPLHGHSTEVAKRIGFELAAGPAAAGRRVWSRCALRRQERSANKVYTTAIAMLSLSVEYLYLRLSVEQLSCLICSSQNAWENVDALSLLKRILRGAGYACQEVLVSLAQLGQRQRHFFARLGQQRHVRGRLLDQFRFDIETAG